MTRIPRIKFPQRIPKFSTSGTKSQTKAASETLSTGKISTSKSDVPLRPTSSGGGTASVQPKRTPLSDKEIEAVLVAASDFRRLFRIKRASSGNPVYRLLPSFRSCFCLSCANPHRRNNSPKPPVCRTGTVSRTVDVIFTGPTLTTSFLS